MPDTKAVLITGCSTGIGRATAQHLAKKGFLVYATARKPEVLEDLKASGCRTIALDVNDEASMSAAVSQIESETGGIGALINNAGYAVERAAETTPMSEIRKQFETNVFGLIRLCQLVLPGMRERRGGRIINISSVGGKVVFPGGAYYHATKHAVEAFSDALRFEVAPWGIHVVIVEPGLIKTAFGDTATSEPEPGPYADFDAAISKLMTTAYDGALAKMAGAVGPEHVAEVLERALVSKRPRTRYRITTGARFMLATRKFVPDRVWDVMMRSQYPRPKPST